VSERRRWSSGFSLARLTVVVDDGQTHAVAIAHLTRQERRLKPELQRGGEQVEMRSLEQRGKAACRGDRYCIGGVRGLCIRMARPLVAARPRRPVGTAGPPGMRM